MHILQNKKMASTDGDGSEDGLSCNQSVAGSKETSYDYEGYDYDNYQSWYNYWFPSLYYGWGSQGNNRGASATVTSQGDVAPPPPPPTLPPNDTSKQTVVTSQPKSTGPGKDIDVLAIPLPDYDKSSDEESDREEGDYRTTINLALAALGKPRMEEKEKVTSDLRIKEQKKRKGAIVFPLTQTMDRNFNNAWKGAIKGQKSDILDPPQRAIKMGKTALPDRLPFRKWYTVDKDSHAGWPLKGLELDANCDLLGLTQKKSLINDWIDLNGRVCGVLNQCIFFAEASKNILSTDLKEQVKEEGLCKFEALEDFLDSRAKALDDLAILCSSLQVNLMLAKRDEVINSTDKLSDSEKLALRYVAPVDKEGRLFSGALEEFAAAKNKREEQNAIVEALAGNRKRKFENSGSQNSKVARLEESLRDNRSDRNPKSRDRNNRGFRDSERFDRKKEGFPKKEKRKWFRGSSGSNRKDRGNKQ